MDHFDVAIIGAGAIGLAIAQRLTTADFMQQRSIVTLEQEATFGQHTSSRNSEVIHAGIYYNPGSLKARLCRRGKKLIYEYCQLHNVPFKRTGKLIVAGEGDFAKLEALEQQARANGVVDLHWIDDTELRNLEPAIQAHSALFSASSGIIDSHAYMQRLLQQAEANGALFSPRSRILEIGRKGDRFLLDCEIIASGAPIQKDIYRFSASHIVNCAGLNATEIASRTEGISPASIPQIHLCKGDYFTYRRKSPFNHLIYPVPDANNTGLGIHATLDLAGQLKFGPDVQYVESARFDVNPDKARDYALTIANYFPTITTDDLSPGYAGIRPKLSGPGEAEADFMIQGSSHHQVPGLVQLFGIESPGLTASLAIAEEVVELIRADIY